MRWRAWVFCSMWSHFCGSWYLPMFLFNEGSFTWMNMASLMGSYTAGHSSSQVKYSTPNPPSTATKTSHLFSTHQLQWGHKLLIGKYSRWGCHPYIPYYTRQLPHTPYTSYTHTPLLPHLSGAIFGKYPIHMYLIYHLLLDLMKWPQYGGCKSLSLNNMWNHFIVA